MFLVSLFICPGEPLGLALARVAGGGVVVRTGPSLPCGGTSVSSCPPPGLVLTVNSVLCRGVTQRVRSISTGKCGFSSSKGAPVLVALWGFPVCTWAGVGQGQWRAQAVVASTLHEKVPPLYAEGCQGF